MQTRRSVNIRRHDVNAPLSATLIDVDSQSVLCVLCVTRCHTISEVNQDHANTPPVIAHRSQNIGTS
jgi:hypothetical protein